MEKTYTIAIAGTTAHTVMCAEALGQDPRFTIPWILTPTPKPVGRKKIITKNPLHLFAEQHNLPTILVEKKIDARIKDAIFQRNQSPTTNHQPLDFLLVVDFGYLIPSWLLELPRIAPLNIHPSALPKYRGSSPGQFVLLYGDKKSAITLMKMDEGLDTGPLIAQFPFLVDQSWNAQEYYHHAFKLIQPYLADRIVEFAENKLHAVTQPTDTPTPIAGRLSKEDSFIDWKLLRNIISPTGREHQVSSADMISEGTSELLQSVFSTNHSWPQTIAQAVKGFSPWPGVWTLVPTKDGQKRMKILETSLDENNLYLVKVHLESETATSFNVAKNEIID